MSYERKEKMPREKPPKPEELIERLEEKVPQFFNTVVIINPITVITVAIIERPERRTYSSSSSTISSPPTFITITIVTITMRWLI